MNLRQLILDAPDLDRTAVIVPEWVDGDGKPVTVYVSMMGGLSRSKWNNDAFDADGKAKEECLRARLLVHCLVDEQGNQIFTEADIEALERKNGEVLSRLFVEAKRINRLGTSDEPDAVEKN